MESVKAIFQEVQRTLKAQGQHTCRVLRAASNIRVIFHSRVTALRLSGSITALATPFLVDGALDLQAWERMLLKQKAAGTSGVVVAGSTGEAAALTDEEFDLLLSTAVRLLKGSVAVLAGTGHSNTAKTILQTRRAADLGADAALVVTPPYVRPTQEGLLAHYRAVADQGGLPVVLYNVPGRTGVDLLPATVAQLVGYRAIVGLKEAVGDAQRWAELSPLASAQFSLLSGDDPTFVNALRAGASGVISVASNLVPASFAAICADAVAGRWGEAVARDTALALLYEFLAISSNPIPLKAVLAAQGLGVGLRLPLLPLAPEQAGHLPAIIDLIERAEAEASVRLAA